jgi:hypothetical protein
VALVTSSRRQMLPISHRCSRLLGHLWHGTYRGSAFGRHRVRSPSDHFNEKVLFVDFCTNIDYLYDDSVIIMLDNLYTLMVYQFQNIYQI